jgi:hypothetical protein
MNRPNSKIYCVFFKVELCFNRVAEENYHIKNKQGGFITQFSFSIGPTYILYLIKKTSDNTWSPIL